VGSSNEKGITSRLFIAVYPFEAAVSIRSFSNLTLSCISGVGTTKNIFWKDLLSGFGLLTHTPAVFFEVEQAANKDAKANITRTWALGI
jgi:hypothetical protein